MAIKSQSPSQTTASADSTNLSVATAGGTLQNGGGNISKSEATAIWSSLTPILVVGEAVAFAIVVALGMLVALTAGGSAFVQNIVLGLVVSVVVYAVLPVLLYDFVVALVYELEGDANRTTSQGFQQVTWSAVADAVGFFDGGLTTVLATSALWNAWFNPAAKIVWLDTTAFAFGLEGLIMSAVAAAQKSTAIAAEAMIWSGISIVLDVAAVTTDKAGLKRGLDVSTFALDAGSLALSVSAL